jgi:CDP-4-dehydro-6-deoxyglucose reductase
MAYQFQEATIVNIIDENDIVKRFFIKVPDEIPFTYKAGQFIMLDLPIEGKYTNRSYSIASAPSNDHLFELCIVLNPTGKGTTYMWENFKVGTTVKISKVLGKFVLPDPLDVDLCLVCTGTGVAPLRAMLVDLVNNTKPHKKIYMVFGNRWEKDIIYRKELEEMQAKHPEFEFHPVLSRENPGWSGHKGYVHDVYEEIFKDRREAYFYICGWKDMLNEARQRLDGMGYDKKHIHFESYD